MYKTTCVVDQQLHGQAQKWQDRSQKFCESDNEFFFSTAISTEK